MSLKLVSGNNKYKACYTSFVLCVLLLVKMSSHSLIRLIYLLYVKKRAMENAIILFQLMEYMNSIYILLDSYLM